MIRENAITKELAKEGDISIINLVNYLLEDAVNTKVSDIHIDPSLSCLKVRFRIDGVMTDAYEFPIGIHQEIISRIKVLSRLRIDEHHATQDGRFRYELSKNSFVDIRVSIAPTYHGENSVLRLLIDRKEQFTLDALGYTKDDIKKIQDAIKKTSGMILSTGPTGSGKTTTLYTLVKMLNTKEVSIITIEDPIEYSIEGIEQIQINPRTNLTFASGLRSVLRQDPNIIMVGEIRDSETANIAVNTALTGHLLLSSVHTNEASTTIPRLLDMGIEAYLIASTLRLAIGQRLVRKICRHCKKEETITPASKEAVLKLSAKYSDTQKMWRGQGCLKCNNTGYSGRIAINELLVVNNDIRTAILKKASASEIKVIAIANGMVTMLEDGLAKVEKGETTLEEILRLTHE